MTAAGWKGAVAAPLPEPARRIPVAANSDRLERARAYVLKMPEAISGSGGHAATWNVARKLAADFELPEGDVLSVLVHDYNPRCQPQWSERELRHKAQQAVQKARVANPIEERQWEPSRPRSRSEKRPVEAAEAEIPMFDDPEPSDDDAPDAPPAETQPAPPSAQRTRISLIEPAAIFAPLEEPDYVVDRVIRRGSLTQLVGYGGGFKTWTGLQMVLSVGSGLPWLGRFEVKQGRAVYLDYENGQYEMRRRAHALAKASGLSSVENIGFACMPPVYMSDPKFGAAVEPLADGCSLLVVDTLKAANPGTDENDSNMRLGLDALRRVGEKTGCAFLILVHSKKTSGSVMTIDPREAGRGSSAIYDAADTVFHATYVQGEPLRIQQTKARLGRPVDPFLVTITDTADGGVLVSAVDAPKEPGASDAAERFDTACLQVLGAVREWPGSSKGTLREKLGMRNATVGAALDRLARDGAVRNAGTKSEPKWFPLGAGGSRDD